VRRLGVVDAGASGLGVGLYRVVERRLVLEGVAGDRVHGDDPERLREACEGCAWIALDQAGRGPFDALVLSGGRARAPELRAAVEAAFGQRATGGFAALGAAALGAAILAYARAQGGRSVTVDESAYEPVVATVRSLPPDGSAASRPVVGGPATSPPRDAAERRAYAVAPPAPSAPPDAENLTRAPAWRAPQVVSAPVIIAERPTSAAHPAAPVIVAVGGGAGASCSAPLGGPPTGAPGAPGVPLPTSIGSGTARNPGTVEELIKLPLDRALTRADLDHLWLPVLLCRVVARRGITGTLTLESGSSSATLAVLNGQPHLRTPEHAALPRAFLWDKVAYSFDPRPPDERGRTATSMAKVAIEGLRARGRTFSVAELEQGIGPRLELAPVLRADRRGLVGKLGLDRREHRLVEEMDGFCTARELGAGGLGHHTTLQLCVILTAFGFVEWRAPARRAETSIHQQLEQRALRMEAANHFDALGVHWSASVADAELALASLHHELGPGTRANAEHPEACQRMIARAERAVAALREPAKLREYRRSLHPDIDFEALDDLMAKRIEALEMKHDEREVNESRRAREVIAAVSMRPQRPSLPGPGRSR
ncbi:MAG TPA: DUF4388 domain-containing protein, partial [Polyangiaceae bacterium]|nr:DUF4388 domain-containing protein [Polyangiaceae bacterium]